jgi:hypothetical protein
MKKLLSTAICSSIFLLSLCQLCPAAIPTEFKLTASDGESKEAFGYAVSIDCDRCIVGAFGDDDNGDLSGSAYIFEWNGTSWSQKAKLTASATKNSTLKTQNSSVRFLCSLLHSLLSLLLWHSGHIIPNASCRFARSKSPNH